MKYVFNFRYAGHTYSQTEDERNEGHFTVDDCIYEMEASPEFYTLLLGFVESALKGKPLQITVL